MNKDQAELKSSSRSIQKGQENVQESMEMPRPSYFTVRLLSEQSCPCSAPPSLFIFLLTLLLLIIPLVPTRVCWWMSSFAANLIRVKPGHCCCCLPATSVDTGYRYLSVWILYVNTLITQWCACLNTHIHLMEKYLLETVLNVVSACVFPSTPVSNTHTHSYQTLSLVLHLS